MNGFARSQEFINWIKEIAKGKYVRKGKDTVGAVYVLGSVDQG